MIMDLKFFLNFSIGSPSRGTYEIMLVLISQKKKVDINNS